MHNNFIHTIFLNRLFLIITEITCLLFFTTTLVGQNTDSIKKAETTSNISKIGLHERSPKKAAIMSAIVPGLGQAYNKKYWKIPIIYIGAGALVYSLDSNHKKYVTYRDAYRSRIDGDSTTNDNFINIYSNDQLVKLYQYYHRFRDLSVIGLGAVYLFNIVDATVDAHLSTFDVSDDLTIKIQPTIINTASKGKIKYNSGICLSLNF